MPSYWIFALIAALLLSGLSDASRIQRLEAQNQELLSRLVRLERIRTVPKDDAADEDVHDGAAGQDTPGLA